MSLLPLTAKNRECSKGLEVRRPVGADDGLGVRRSGDVWTLQLPRVTLERLPANLGHHYMPRHHSHRPILATAAWLCGAVACGEQAGDSPTGQELAGSERPDAVAAETPEATVTPGVAEMSGGEAAPPIGSRDEVYANVTAVTVTGEPMNYSFSVTVESADVDCSQYADWWEVLGEDGTLIYRRILTHSHTDDNGTTDADAPGNSFTRSGGPVEAGAAQNLYVRAHMSIGGYRGDTLGGSVQGGFGLAATLPKDFAAVVEVAPPQPEGCSF